MQAWALPLRKTNRIEGVQKRGTNLIPSLRNKEYEEILKETELIITSLRRSRGDLIKVNKILNKLDNIDFELSQTGLRSNHLKMKQRKWTSDPHKRTLSRRVPEF